MHPLRGSFDRGVDFTTSLLDSHRAGRYCTCMSVPARIPSAGVGFVAPCLPSSADRPPKGAGWIHEIKHDGFRMMLRRNGVGIRLFTRKGTTGLTGIRSFNKQHMLCGPPHFCLMAKQSIAMTMASPISIRSATGRTIEPSSYMHLISSSLMAATCAANQLNRAKQH
jgi:hypothetical protein